MRPWLACVLATLFGCSEDGSTALQDGGITIDTAIADGPIVDAPGDGAGATGLGLRCSATTAPPSPNPCPAPPGGAGRVSFCFRPGWSGVTGVDVYGGFGHADDWTAPFLALS